MDGAEAGPFAGDDDPSLQVRRRWQRSAGAAVDKRVFEVLFAELDSASRALLLSQSGAGASCALTVLPTGPDFVDPTRSSESCCSGDCVWRCRSHPGDASVGAASTAWVTTGLLAPKSGSWRTGLGRWSARRRASAGKPVPGSPQVSPCEN